jgi:Arc/MetJ family transcription regulator
MRTNVVLDEKLVEQAKELTGIHTTRAVIEEALRFLIQVYSQGQVRALRGRLHWEGNLEEMREARDHAAG